jgi:hypothetical protein
MGGAAGQVPVFKAVDVKAVGARERAQLVEAQQAAALSKAAEAGAPLDRPRFKLPAAGAASKASGGGGGRGGGGGGGGDGRGGGETLTLGQLAQKGLQVDISVTEPVRTAAEERAFRADRYSVYLLY